MNPAIAGPEAQQPKLPDIHPQAYEALNALDAATGKMALTREEHGKLINNLQYLLRYINDLEGRIRQFSEAANSGPQQEIPAFKKQ